MLCTLYKPRKCVLGSEELRKWQRSSSVTIRGVSSQWFLSESLRRESIGDTVAVVGPVEKDDEEATVWRGGHPPRGQQSVRDLRAISVTPPGNGAPRRGIPSCASPCHTDITFVSEMCGNGGARPSVGPPAKWAREARRSGTLRMAYLDGQQTSVALRSYFHLDRIHFHTKSLPCEASGFMVLSVTPRHAVNRA